MHIPVVRRVQLDERTIWEFSKASKQVTFWNGAGIFREFEYNCLVDSIWNWQIVLRAAKCFALVSDCYISDLFRLNGENGDIESVVHLNRSEDDDRGFFWCKFEVCGDLTLFVYERGVVCLNSSGFMKWRQDDGKLDWHFLGVDNHVVMYSQEQIGRWGYRLSDGERVDCVL